LGDEWWRSKFVVDHHTTGRKVLSCFRWWWTTFDRITHHHDVKQEWIKLDPLKILTQAKGTLRLGYIRTLYLKRKKNCHQLMEHLAQMLFFTLLVGHVWWWRSNFVGSTTTTWTLSCFRWWWTTIDRITRHAWRQTRMDMAAIDPLKILTSLWTALRLGYSRRVNNIWICCLTFFGHRCSKKCWRKSSRNLFTWWRHCSFCHCNLHAGIARCKTNVRRMTRVVVCAKTIEQISYTIPLKR
jgi:hypothetical protein